MAIPWPSAYHLNPQIMISTIIIGLGNHGLFYERNRHNVGFMAIDRIAAAFNAQPFQFNKRCLSDIAQATASGQSVLLVKPRTMMNESGKAVALLRSLRRIENRRCWVVCDDFHLPIGMLRIRRNGSSAGHRGIESVIECLHSQDFPRFRIGIYPQQGQIIDPKNFVLKNFLKSELLILKKKVFSLLSPLIVERLGAREIKNESFGKDPS